MPRLAIVIRAVGSTESMESTLVSVLENRPADSEILVALGGPYSDPYDLKGEVCFVKPRLHAPTVEILNEAIAATRAPFVHVLASGCTVTEGWADRALQRFGDRHIGAVAPLVMRADQDDVILAAGIGYRAAGRRYLVGECQRELSRDTVDSMIGPALGAAFYRKAALDLAGGFSSRLGPTQADAELALTLGGLGFGVALEPQSRVLASGFDGESSPFRQALYEERLFWRNLPGAGRWHAIAAHAGLVAWELASSLPRPRAIAQLAARSLAFCQAPLHIRRQPPADAGLPRSKSTQWRVDSPHAVSRSEGTRTAPSR